MVGYGNCRVHEDPQTINNDLLLVKILFVVQHMKNNFPVGLQRAPCKLSSWEHRYLFLGMKLIKAVCCTRFESSAGNFTGKKEGGVKVLVRDEFTCGNCTLQLTYVSLLEFYRARDLLPRQLCQTLKISCNKEVNYSPISKVF